MKKPNRVTVVFGTVVLAATVVVGAFSASAAGGDQTDPLVTLSYLTEVVTPTLMNKVDEQVAANEKNLEDKFNAAIDGYVQKMDEMLSQGAGSYAVFVPAAVSAGQTLYPQAGCEVLLRSGSAKVSAGSSALLDTTAGSSLSSGGALTSNHLYVAAETGGAISVSSSAQFLVRGSYTFS